MDIDRGLQTTYSWGVGLVLTYGNCIHHPLLLV